MSNKPIKSFQEFYSFYLIQHSHKANIALHFMGTSAVLIIIVYTFLSRDFRFLWLAPVFGYGLAWLGHFFFQKNKPATFKYPAWSLLADFLLYYHVLTLQIEDKLKAALKE